MPGKGPGPSVKDADQYEAVKREYRREHPEASEEQVKSHAARITNASVRRRRFKRGRRG